jgi:glycogen debranching enzyme
VRSADAAVLIYDGIDGRERKTALTFDPEPQELTTRVATYQIVLGPKQAIPIFLSVGCGDPEPPQPARYIRGLLAAFRDHRAGSRHAATVATSNQVFNEVLCRSMADLYMLMTRTAQGPYPYAGIPWFSTTFGRDGLITALQTLWVDPRIARGVLQRLAAHQARADDPAADAQPGKILHEMRRGEMAKLGEIPFGLYYGSVDSTPLFALLAGLYWQRTGDDESIRALWPAIEAALAWIDGPGDTDGDGFVEYYRMTETGLSNQGWKDSFDAVFHADGRLAEGPIALAEVQGYVYAAKKIAASCAERIGKPERARILEAEADDLARRFDASFWCPEIEMYALALDGAKRPCRVRSSNAGQVLFTGIARPERAAKIADHLLRPQFFSGWGIRTIAKGEALYNPMSYHNGSVWPHDNALIALGLARYGHKRPLERLFKGLFDAASYFDMRRLPELFCGFQRARGRGPTLYPVACSPQAWASATPFTLIEAALGLEFDPAVREIRLLNPCLPAFLDEVVLRNVQLMQSTVDLRLRRHENEVSLEILRRRGKVQVSIVYT